MKHLIQFPAALAALLCFILLTPSIEGQEKAPQQKMFASPGDAVKALSEAAQNKNKPALREIFGPAVHELMTGDEVQDSANFNSFSKAISEGCIQAPESSGKIVLEIGANKWPFPIPLVKKDGQWFFDTDAGREEIICRHIGRGELNAIGVCRAYVEAQHRYFSHDYDGSGIHKYALKLKSAPEKKDGLYWPAGTNEEPSPFGALAAEAHAQGYGKKKEGQGPQPFHGYYFKILTAQGRAAPGGKSNYIVKGNMTGGFALVAYPAFWGRSGVMTFIVNQDGKVYQRNLGEKTAATASTMTRYNPNNKWNLVEESGITEK